MRVSLLEQAFNLYEKIYMSVKKTLDTIDTVFVLRRLAEEFRSQNKFFVF